MPEDAHTQTRIALAPEPIERALLHFSRSSSGSIPWKSLMPEILSVSSSIGNPCMSQPGTKSAHLPSSNAIFTNASFNTG